MPDPSPPRLPKAALVTGGARRIGRVIVETLAERGFAVAIHHHRSADEAASLAAAIEARGGRAVSIGANLAKEAEVVALLADAEDTLGPLGLLVNNASMFEYDSALEATRASWDGHLETNLRAPFVLTQGFARALPAGAEGLVVNILDQRVWNLTPHFVSYTVSKAALWTLTQSLALALAPRIRVNAVGPGPTLANVRQTPEQFAEQCARLPLQRGASPEEVARAVCFMLDLPSMTGQMIALDGGQHLAWSTPPPAHGEE